MSLIHDATIGRFCKPAFIAGKLQRANSKITKIVV